MSPPDVDDLDQIIDVARRRVRALLARAHGSMETGARIDRVMDTYVRRAFDLEAEIDAQAVLASAGDSAALNAITRCLSELKALRDQFDAEFGDQE